MKAFTKSHWIIGTLMLLMSSSAFSHTTGTHAGGFMQQLQHLLQSADHLLIIVALAIVAGIAVYQYISKNS